MPAGWERLAWSNEDPPAHLKHFNEPALELLYPVLH